MGKSVSTKKGSAELFQPALPLDGKRTLRELIAAVASRMQTNPETVIPACLATVRKLMQAGFLSSVAGPSKSTL